MKMTKSVKLLTVILSCLLLIGTVIGISVSANDGPTVEIAHKNLSYEGAIKVLYAVKAENLAEGDTVAVNFYSDAEGTSLLYTKTDSGLDIDLGAEDAPEVYDIVFSDGISPKNMRKNVYAKAVIVDKDGNEVASSALSEYSIWQYAVNRFEKSPSEDQLALYTAMLNYGASVQKVLMDNGKYTEAELLAAGGYANEYCGIKVNTVVDGETVASGETVYYAPKTEVSLGADKVYNGASVFESYLDADGAQVGVNGWNKETVTAAKPGTAIYTATYVTTGTLPETFDGAALDTSIASPTGNAATGAEATRDAEYTDTSDGKVYTITVVKEGKLSVDTEQAALKHERHYRIISIKDADGNPVNETPDGLRTVGTALLTDNTKTYPEIGKFSGNSNFVFKNQTEKQTYGMVKRHVFETDIWYNGNGTMQCYLRADAQNFFWGFNIGKASNGNYAYMSQAGKDSQGLDNSKSIADNLPIGDWINVRIEYYPLADGKFEIYVYVNGELCPPTHYETPSDAWVNTSQPGNTGDDDYIAQAYMNFVTAASQMDLLYDNTYFATEYEAKVGTGKYANDENTLTYDYASESVASSYSNPLAMNTALGFYSARYTQFNGSTTSSYYSVLTSDNSGNNYLLSGTNGQRGGTSVGWATPYALIGDTYVFETDLLWNGAQTDVTDNDAVYFRIYDALSTSSNPHNDNNAITFLRLVDSGVSSDTYKFGDANLGYATLKKGEWANIRLEATPLTTTTVRNELYVNGKLVYAADQNVNKVATATTNTYSGAYFFTRTSTTSTQYSFAFDNTYVGVIKSEEHVGAYYGDSTISGTRYDFTSGETFEVYDAETAPNGIYSGTPTQSLTTNNKSLSITDKGELFFDSQNAWRGVSFANKGNTTGSTGDKYVFETDFTWHSGIVDPTSTDTVRKGAAFIGFTSDNDNNVNMFARRYANYTESDTSILEVYGAILKKNVKYNIRIEHVVGEKVSYMYVDNKLVSTVSHDTGASSVETVFKGFAMYNRPRTTEGFTCTFDNVFVGIIPAAAE